MKFTFDWPKKKKIDEHLPTKVYEPLCCAIIEYLGPVIKNDIFFPYPNKKYLMMGILLAPKGLLAHSRELKWIRQID